MESMPSQPPENKQLQMKGVTRTENENQSSYPLDDFIVAR
jgi:hypothetical protein